MLRLLSKPVLVLVLVGMALAGCGNDGAPLAKERQPREAAERLNRLADMGYVQQFSDFENVLGRDAFDEFVCTPEAVWEAVGGDRAPTSLEEFEVDDSMLSALAMFVAMCSGVHPGDVIGSQSDALPDEMDTANPLRRQQLTRLLTHEVTTMYEIAKG